ncbi:metalloregulator ArsR/SmtB family transcription factor [uncultured Cohaesibacter sp.]|uniref:helix-turn-helix transcriptional regulator n=1 Tax=uncultured Cohaesibacter sp. TaxID=1002546 RepID=UPI002AA8171D|nr:metalloregulator ArsR/SmtB family transcription factor [uncultured Cohaesibacter sp.]
MTLKMNGAMTSAQMGKRLNTTGEGARQHLVRLSEEGLVTEERRIKGRGRPSVYWSLTQQGHDHFPDTHSDLAVDLLDSIQKTVGPETLDKIITLRGERTQERYRGALDQCASLAERVERLAVLRSAEGYMSTMEVAPDGSFLLFENHCPICAAARLCQNFCRSELEVFRALLGPEVKVERVEHILRDGRRCAYQIRRHPSEVI